MSETTLNTTQLKELLKSVIFEVLQEHKEVFTDIIIEAMEDIAFTKAMEEGKNTESVSREDIFKILSQQS